MPIWLSSLVQIAGVAVTMSLFLLGYFRVTMRDVVRQILDPALLQVKSDSAAALIAVKAEATTAATALKGDLRSHEERDDHRFELIQHDLARIVEATAGIGPGFPALVQRVEAIDGRMRESIASHQTDEKYNRAFRHWMQNCVGQLSLSATLVARKTDTREPVMPDPPEEGAL